MANNIERRIYTTYIPTEDKTVVWQDLVVGNDCIQTMIVGWYCGEPDESWTKDFSNLSTAAHFDSIDRYIGNW